MASELERLQSAGIVKQRRDSVLDTSELGESRESRESRELREAELQALHDQRRVTSLNDDKRSAFSETFGNTVPTSNVDSALSSWKRAPPARKPLMPLDATVRGQAPASPATSVGSTQATAAFTSPASTTAARIDYTLGWTEAPSDAASPSPSASNAALEASLQEMRAMLMAAERRQLIFHTQSNERVQLQGRMCMHVQNKDKGACARIRMGRGGSPVRSS